MNEEGFDFVAEMDQMKAMLGTMAKVLHGYYFDLIKEGFDDDQALMLVMSWQSEFFQSRRHPDEE